ncbi:MAG: peptidylprolyl isomerase [Hominimerdicola sp.]
MKLKKIFKTLALGICSAVMMTSFAACSDKNDSSSEAASSAADESKTFVITLDAENAPITCENFEKLVSEGFYDGLTFHRIVEDFMAQGGDPNGDGTGGSSETIKGEFSENGVDNKLSHTRGVVSMARSSDPDSASSQFFICYTDDDTFLDGQYAAFGNVTEGMEVVDEFLTVERTQGTDGAISSPVTPIKIVKAEMIDDDADGNHRVKFYMDF